MSNFAISAFRNIATKEHGTREGEFSQDIVDSLETGNQDDFYSAFAKKVGDRGGQVELKDQKEQVIKLASVLKRKFRSKIGADFENKFLTPFAENVTEEQVNERARELMSIIGCKCEDAMTTPEFDAVRNWVKLDYATSRALYG